MPWNPDVYHKFEKERSAPFDDLLALVSHRQGIEVVDLGCGTGELTLQLAEALPESNVLGLDNSPEMLSRAYKLARSGLQFQQGNIEDVRGKWDLVFSHAAVQWVDDHQRLIPQLLSLVRPGGQLVVQMPSNHNSFAHTTIRQIALEAPFREALGGWNRQSPVLSLESYADLLYENGGRDLVVFEKVYPHVLENAEAVAEWTRGTALVPYLERLPQELQTAFLEEYTNRLRAHWPSSPVFYGFKRILFGATIPA
jgi:trans-aconitate 2-methyltransferase